MRNNLQSPVRKDWEIIAEFIFLDLSPFHDSVTVQFFSKDLKIPKTVMSVNTHSL